MSGFIHINVNDALAYSEIRVGLDVGGLYNRVDDLGLYDGTNPFNYVRSTPLHAVDPDGRLLMFAAPLAMGGGSSLGGALGSLAVGLGVRLGIAAAATAVATVPSATDQTITPPAPMVMNFPDAANDADYEQCDADEEDPCDELLEALQLLNKLIRDQYTQTNRINRDDIKYYREMRKNFCMLCPSRCGEAPSLPGFAEGR